MIPSRTPVNPPKENGPSGRASGGNPHRPHPGVILTPQPHVVGRQAEIDRVGEFLGQVTHRAGGLLLLSGEGGVGKTRLLHETEARAAALEMVVLSIDCATRRRGVPYAPWVEMIRQYVDSSPREQVFRTARSHLGALAQLVPDLEDRIWLYDPTQTPVEPDRRSLLDAVVRFWVALSDVQPVLISMDNLERADTGSLELLGSVVQACREFPLGVVATFRDTHVEENKPFHHFLVSLEGQQRCTTAALAPLDREHLGELIGAILGQTEVPREVRDAVYGKTKGNPSYATEWLQWLVNQGKVNPESKVWTWPSTSDLALPAAVERAIEVRLGRFEEPGHTGNLSPKRIAVLPFVSLSPDPNDEYFADGLTEEMVARLSLLKGLEVIARTSVMTYKNKTKGAGRIGRELGAGTLLEGSVRKAGNRIRVTVQLIDVSTQGHLWAESYNRDLEDIFAVQAEIAERVASALKVRLHEEERKRIEKRGTNNLEAYTLLLKGRFHLNRWERASVDSAIECFVQALNLSPNYAAAYAGLARAYSILGFLEVDERNEAYSKAEEYALRALELDESLAEAHVSRSYTLWNKYDFAARDAELERALALDPNSAEAHLLLADGWNLRGRWDKALPEIEKALELDPLSVRTAGDAGTSYLYYGQYDRAIQLLTEAVELDPKNSFYLNNLGLAHIRQGRIDEGLEEVQRAAGMSDFPETRDLAYAYVKAGRPEEARALLSRLLQSREGGRAYPMRLAGVYSVLGEKEKAFEWLEMAYEERSGYLPAIASDFVFDSLRDDPRFLALLKKMNLA